VVEVGVEQSVGFPSQLEAAESQAWRWGSHLNFGTEGVMLEYD
jgi:hypothetical protein